MSPQSSEGPPRITQPAVRLDPATFALPVEAIRRGEYTDRYFLHAQAVLARESLDSSVTMQVFQKKSALLCGIDEAIAILTTCIEADHTRQDIEIHALRDGDFIVPFESVMHITGPYRAFAHLETLYLGSLARATMIATSTRRVVEAAWPKPVVFFPARHDHWSVQRIDGYAAHLAGVSGVSTDAQASWWGGEGIGTVPHALIACFDGDTVAATVAFAQAVGDDVRVISLVDFDNDSAATAVAVARALGDRLYGVRLDTSETMVDRGLIDEMGDFPPTGVNAHLVHHVRNALDEAGYKRVAIVVSGGFDTDRIRRFQQQRVPVDMYGVGSSLLRERYDFTADIVIVNGAPRAKAGRMFRPNPRLERVR